MTQAPTAVTIGLLAFPNITQLDLTGPYEVFSRMRSKRLEIVAKTTAPIRSDTGFVLTPTVSYAECPQLDVVFVPGGPGQQALMDDAETLSFLAAQAKRATWIASTCTGSLVLGAAGLIAGKRASCHWLSLPLIEVLGGIPADERVVVDGNLLTTAGVSAGIDGALKLVALIEGEEMAKTIQLMIEYDPEPGFESGSPRTADPALVDRIRSFAADLMVARERAAREAAARLAAAPAEG